MDDALGLISSEMCPHCGQPLPVPVPEEPLKELVAPEVPQDVLVHEPAVVCAVCGDTLTPGQPCPRSDCPRVAAQRIHQASLDTPFKLGL